MPPYHSFEQLDCYQKCRAVRMWINEFLHAHRIVDRDYVYNIRRAGRSTTRNIAEGFGRHHPKDNSRFCYFSTGSLHEILEDLNIAVDENFCTRSNTKPGRILVYAALKSTRGYIKYLSTLQSLQSP